MPPLATAALSALALAACASALPAPPAADVAAERARIDATLDDLHAAAAAADEERYFAHFDPAGVFLGTDASERWDVPAFRAYAHPFFAKGRAWSFRAVRRAVVVAADGRTAWFDEDLATPNLGPARGSGALVRRGDSWRVALYNLAITVPNDRFGPVKEAATTARLLGAASGDALADLAWLAGAWVHEPADAPAGTRVEEVWLAPAGGLMVGAGRTLGTGATAFEHLRIEARTGGAIVYVAAPGGGPATEFTRSASAAPDAVVFTNAAHDWPKHIRYQRVPEGLAVELAGDPGQRVARWTYTRAVITRP